jgi:hypothetical protein
VLTGAGKNDHFSLKFSVALRGCGKVYILTSIRHVYPPLRRRCIMAKEGQSQGKKTEEKKAEKAQEKAKKR